MLLLSSAVWWVNSFRWYVCPCHTRNAIAASNAFVCADLILGGYINPIPLDETIDASFETGKMLPVELRCTALGGIANTPAAKSLFDDKNKF